MRIAIFVAIIQVIFWLGHYAVYRAFVKFFAVTGSQSLLWTRIIFFALSVVFLIATLLAFRYYGPVARVLYWGAAVWMGTLYWLFIAAVLSFLLYYIVGLFMADKSALLLAGKAMLMLALLVSAYGLWNSYQIKVTRVTVKLENLPEAWKGKKVVLVADTHLGHVRNLGFSKKVASLIARQEPEAVFIPGDYYDGVMAAYAELSKPFGEIPSRYGTFFASGNHEEFRPRSVYFEGLRAGGVRVLDNQMVNLDGLQVLGVGYFDTLNPEDQKKIISSLNLDPSVPSVLLKHVPSNIEAAESSGISLQLSGHTHTGQVFPGRWITRKIFKGFEYGLNRQGSTQVFTTSGAGTWGPPQRVGTWPEIVVITFE